MRTAAARGAAGGRGRRAGQAMAETVVAMVFVLFAFLAVLQFADNLRTKLLLEYAAFRCARARTVGYNDFKILKTVRLATMSAAGESIVKNDSGESLTTGDMLARMRTYLSSRNGGAADAILDFDYWRNGRTPMPSITTGGGLVTVDTRQNRPQFFDVFSFLSGSRAVNFDSGDAETMTLYGTASVEAHYPDYLQ